MVNKIINYDVKTYEINLNANMNFDEIKELSEILKKHLNGDMRIKRTLPSKFDKDFKRYSIRIHREKNHYRPVNNLERIAEGAKAFFNDEINIYFENKNDWQKYFDIKIKEDKLNLKCSIDNILYSEILSYLENKGIDFEVENYPLIYKTK